MKYNFTTKILVLTLALKLERPKLRQTAIFIFQLLSGSSAHADSWDSKIFRSHTSQSQRVQYVIQVIVYTIQKYATLYDVLTAFRLLSMGVTLAYIFT